MPSNEPLIYLLAPLGENNNTINSKGPSEGMEEDRSLGPLPTQHVDS